MFVSTDGSTGSSDIAGTTNNNNNFARVFQYGTDFLRNFWQVLDGRAKGASVYRGGSVPKWMPALFLMNNAQYLLKSIK